MKTLTQWRATGLGALLAFAVIGAHAETRTADSLETAFVDNGKVTLDLSAGEHRITASPDNHIRVRWSFSENVSSRKVDARSDVEGTNAKIKVDGPRNFRTVIAVPKHSDLVIRVSAGEVSVEKIVGDKDIRLRAGDLSVDVGDADQYALVDGSLWAGDIDAGPFDYASGGLFRSVEWQGSGEHELKFKLRAGDVTLYEGD